MSASPDCDGGDGGGYDDDDCVVQSVWMRNCDVCDGFSIHSVMVLGL